MKPIVYTRSEPSLHPRAGILRPGVNVIHDDRLADELLTAGAFTGDFRPVDGAVSSPPAGKPYHAVDGEVHHVFDDCTVGNNVEVKNRRRGTGEKPLCTECAGHAGTPAAAEEKE